MCARDFVAEAPGSSGVEAAGDRGSGDGGAEPGSGSVGCWGPTNESKSCRKDGSDVGGRRDS